MKKLFVLSLVALLAFAAVVPASASQVQYPAELEYIDAQIAIFLPRLDAFEYQYFTQTGEYWQALQSHDTPPAGVEIPDNLNSIPTDGTTSLAVMWDYAALPVALGWSWSVSTYSGPDGLGYVLTVSTAIDGVQWRKSINRGPEQWRGADWWLFDPNEIL